MALMRLTSPRHSTPDSGSNRVADPEPLADSLGERLSTSPGASPPSDTSTPRDAFASPSAGVLRGALALFSTQPLTWGASFAVAVLAPRLLGDEGLGQYSVASTIANLGVIAALLGVPDYLRRRVATRPDRVELEGGAAILMLGTITVAIAAILAIVLPLTGLPIARTLAFHIALLGMLTQTAQRTLFGLLNGQGKHSRVAWINAASVVASAAAGITALLLGGRVNGYLAATVAAAGGLTALGWYLCGPKVRRVNFDRALWTELLRGGLPFLGLSLAIQVRVQIDVVLVGTLLSEQMAGWLAAAYRITSIPLFIPVLIATPLLPALSRVLHDRALFRQTLSQSVWIVTLLMVPISATLIALAPDIPQLLNWGHQFDQSVVLMQVLSLEEPIVALDMVLVTALIALHRERQWLRVAVGGAIFNPAVNLVVLGLFGHQVDNGPLLATFVEIATEAVMFLGVLALMPRDLLQKADLIRCVSIVASGICLYVTISALRPLPLHLGVLVGELVFVLAIFGLRVIQIAHLRALPQLATQLAARKRRSPA